MERYAIIGASHDIIEEGWADVNAKIRDEAQKYAAGGLMPSHKFVRVRVSPLDENKFLMPVMAGLSSTGLLALQAVARGIKTCVVGSEQVGTYVQLINEYLHLQENYSANTIVFSREDTVPRLDKTIRQGYDALGKPKKYMFICGDIPLVNLEGLVRDYDSFDPSSAVLWLDFNARERIFPSSELFGRNYYETFLELDKRKGILSGLLDFVNGKNRLYSYKEPNAYFFSSRFDQWNLISDIYDYRKNGKLNITAAVAIMLRNRGISLEDTYRVPMSLPFILLDAAARLVWKKALNKKVYTRGGFQRLARLVLNRDVKATISHADPFRLKDIDAWHDLIYYRELMRFAKQRDATRDIFGPAWDLIEGFQQHAAKRRFGIPLLDDFESYARQRAHELGMTEYLDTDGNFVEHVRPDEQISASLEHLLTRSQAGVPASAFLPR